jgi:uncharacterized protein
MAIPALVGQPALTTSFDCSKARSDAERLICTDPELATDNVELTRIFAKAKAALSIKAPSVNAPGALTSS